MLTVKLSSKRQATFPKSVCESLGLEPGDEILLEPSSDASSESSWVLRPAKSRPRPWLNQLNAYAKGKESSMEAIRASIAKGRCK